MARSTVRGGLPSPRRAPALARLRGWRRHHSHCAAESLGRVLQQPLASLMTWLVIGIAIALPTALWIVLENLRAVSGAVDAPDTLSVFLAPTVEEPAARRLAEDLAARSDVENVVFLNRDDALDELVQRSGMEDIVASLPSNPLPHVLLVTPRPAPDELAPAGLLAELDRRRDVQEVVIDTQWLERLRSLVALGERATAVLAVVLLAAVVLVLGNTIRLAIESRRDEIVISKLVGGSDAFVRRPLLYAGLWYGLGGGAAAALLVAAGTMILRPAVLGLAEAYQSSFTLKGLGVVDSLQLLLIGACLGLLGAWLAVFRHLRAIEPR